MDSRASGVAEDRGPCFAQAIREGFLKVEVFEEVFDRRREGKDILGEELPSQNIHAPEQSAGWGPWH